jgi:hypothetical protein
MYWCSAGGIERDFLQSRSKDTLLSNKFVVPPGLTPAATAGLLWTGDDMAAIGDMSKQDGVESTGAGAVGR